MDPSARTLSVLAPLLIILSLSATASTCSDPERRALLRFKSRFEDPGGRFSSWTGVDCCQWTGIACDDATGNVVKLDLEHSEVLNGEGYRVDVNGKLTGELDPSLLELKSLAYLDLSGNDLLDRPMPAWLGSMSQLRHLALSEAGFSGAVPPQLGNLSALEHLDLSSVNERGRPALYLESFSWVSRLTSLKTLSLTSIDLSKLDSAEIIKTLNDNIPSLTDLRLFHCNLSRMPPSVPSLNFSSLTSLDLSYNHIGPVIPPWIFNVSSLRRLNLLDCGIQGRLPDDVSRLSNLEQLVVPFNNFSGSLPPSIGRLCKLTALQIDYSSLDEEWPRPLDDSSCRPLANLRVLTVSSNKIPGPLPRLLEGLANLESLDVGSNLFTGDIAFLLKRLPSVRDLVASGNSLVGEIMEDHLSGMKNLTLLHLDDNNDIRFDLRPEWVPPFQIESLNLSGCRVGPRFPTWIKNQQQIRWLCLSRGGISDEIPSWFWGLSPSLQELDVSSNRIEGEISEKVSAWTRLRSLDLSSNRFSGSIPSSMASMQRIENLDLSYNNLSGEVPHPDFFNASTLLGNPLLCGPPTSVNCESDQDEGGLAAGRFFILGDPSFYLGMTAGALMTLVIARYQLEKQAIENREKGEREHLKKLNSLATDTVKHAYK